MIDSNLTQNWEEMKKWEVICRYLKVNWIIREGLGFVSN